MTDEELKRLLESFAERFDKRFDAVDQRFDGVDKRFDGVDKRFEGVDNRLDALDKKIDDKTTELRKHFDTVAENFDRKFDLLAEGLINLDEKLDRKTSSIETRMEQGFAETHALIKLTHTDLDRRVRVLEQAPKAPKKTLAALKRGSSGSKPR